MSGSDHVTSQLRNWSRDGYVTCGSNRAADFPFPGCLSRPRVPFPPPPLPFFPRFLPPSPTQLLETKLKSPLPCWCEKLEIQQIVETKIGIFEPKYQVLTFDNLLQNSNFSSPKFVHLILRSNFPTYVGQIQLQRLKQNRLDVSEFKLH